MHDFIYNDSEWEIDGALICASVELRLTVETVDNSGIRHEPVFLYHASYVDAGRKCAPAWLAIALKDWVLANQKALAQAYQGDRHSISSRYAAERAVFAAAQERAAAIILKHAAE